ncbi:formylglycine-generating enzyme family protein [Chondromyces apiculatus]|uniref:Sulfatase modifying factor 2 (C-alpha-formyglycine-generating enzyme 2) n=1 Tax=Chondromyces apiculatus DSM 436 TaxID=1192034 RepID=A0A017SX00_9BACT|nr:SUMF1/EgtB/PvdO family nonheme iron enzyme [Chondromyces apiculatus]EYF01115.1 Sulfatase modifying factor 2 precursor (C-alpha-formyglycine- generating enzyme 2) [Chondromyces apiculatus DSM 436]
MSTRVALAVGFTLGAAALATFAVRSGITDNLPAAYLAKGAIRGAVPETLRFQWQLQRNRHWQIVSSPSESRETTDQLENNRGACQAGMIEVKGRMKYDVSPNAHLDGSSIEELQKTTCKRWINRDYPERCGEFDRDKWLKVSKDLPTKEMSFCIDRFEYPNQKGENPWIMVSWYEAKDMCAEEGKRLCNESEWTFACEGEEAMPYPYGYVREPEACIVDQKWRAFHESAFQPRNAAPAMAEMDRLWQGLPSGTQPRCRSPFGVYDMTGNVDEWTRSSREGERPSILKGGYWGPVRTRCRPATRSHDENHTFYQQGFRCCTDPGAEAVQRASTWQDPASAPLPREIK